MGWKTTLWGRVGDGMGVLWGWVGTEVKVDGDGWRWKLNQRGWVVMGVISVTMQASSNNLIISHIIGKVTHSLATPSYCRFQSALSKHVLNIKFYATTVTFICYLCCNVKLCHVS